MKKLLFILFLFVGFVAKSQIVVPRSPIAIASQDARLYATFNLKIPVYADTTTANTYIGHDSVGLVFYNRADSNVYIRDLGLGAHRWKLLGPAGTGNVIDVFGRIGHVIALTGDYAAFYPVLSGAYTDPTWIASLSAGKIVGTQTVTPGSSKIVLGGTPTGAAFQPFSIDIVPANVLLSTLGGTLGIGQINATGAASSSTFLRGDGTWSSPGSTVTGLPNSWVGAGYRLTFNFTNNVRTLFSRGYLVLDSTTNSNGITFFPDTSAGKLATKTDLLTAPTLTSTQIAVGNGSNKMSSSANLYFQSGWGTSGFGSFIGMGPTGAGVSFSPSDGSFGFSYNGHVLGTNNTVIGTQSGVGGSANQNYNTAAGAYAMSTMAGNNPSFNTAIGQAALFSIADSNNIGIGVHSGDSLGSGSGHKNSIFIGNYSGAVHGALSGGTGLKNTIIVGDSVRIDSSNTATFGRNNQRIILGNGGGNTAAMNALHNGIVGAIFFNTDSTSTGSGYCVWIGSKWINLGSGGSSGISLTTNFTSGVATLVGSVLNIPNYSAALAPFSDAGPIVKNSSDGSKQITISAVNLTTATNRTYTGPDVDGILELQANTATLINKTMSAASNTFSGFTNTNLSGTAGITNANLATMAAHTFKLNNTGGSAVPIDATATQATAELNIFASGTKGLVPASGGGTVNFMRADGTWAAPPGGGGSDSGVVAQFGLAQSIVGTTKFFRVDTAALYAAKISYFVNGLGLGLTNHDSVYWGMSPLIQNTHISGSNNFNVFFDSTTLTISKLAPGSRVMTDPTTDALTTQAELLHQPVKYATTGALAANTYANGTAGVGATLTENANGALAAQDGQAITAGDRILVKNEATTSHNGLYTVTQVGTGGTPYILTRGNYSSIAANMAAGSMVYIQTGTTQAGQLWAQTTTGTITFGTTGLVYAGISAGGTVTSVTGTTNRITSTGGTTPAIDISATFEALLGKVANRIDQNNASTTSAQFRGVISDETGTGFAVFATSPLFVTPRLASTSTTGYVWTATDALGNGSFQVSSGGGLSSFTSPNSTITVGGTLSAPTVDVLHPNLEPTSTVSTATSFSLVAGDIVDYIWVDPTSATTGFQVGTTSSGGDVISSRNLLAGSKNDWFVGFRATASTTLFFQGISSSTVITLIKRQ